MKRIIILLLLLIGLEFSVLAQKTSNQEKIEAARIALITRKLNLTPEQARKFWPVYNEFRNKVSDMRKDYDVKRQGIDPAKLTDAQKKAFLDEAFEFKQRQLNLEKEYSQRLLDVISAEQIISLRQAERQFREMLLKRIEQNKTDRRRMDQLRDRKRDRVNRLRDN
ncbi:hypothetical protein QQ008_26680 [Fulvivirgaceae bacterium BMA10]|uniref:Periplasmic heavy metal sensor n=1 Tax=Splendidivirga corallicola TaxID=3051826 RepID=A0ABT8KXX4_9BACT|nr:hypothetical protein [Fulvivirgaceae bacterium BMA10]